MGSCKDNMKPSDSGKDKESLFGRVLPRRRKKAEDDNSPKNFCDHILAADTILSELTAVKARDLDAEKGQETANAKKLAIYKTIQFHMDSIIDGLNDYNDVK